ncbi:spermatogenesis-defective protein 39 homolog [Plutella xylostella]|uniref:spermatogenesis-defective protein 39 homolog n=1 Tax=Plutella xylostella TaxID=51655 RepID=UPI0020331A78|nr:spermatogenesis-defective protein 39 homolog [Plutella xylostella]
MDADDSEYWNTTQVKAFSFDDDILTTQEILAIGQRANLSSSQSDSEGFLSSGAAKPLLPLSSLVSPKVLDLILLAPSGKDPPSKQPKLADSEETVSITLKRLVLGRPCSLHTHRSLKSKTELLDGAVAIGDGNCIISVVLFLIQTLNKKLVYELLSARPTALRHYVSFLQSEGKITELTDLLTMLGRSPEAAMYQYQHHVRAQGNNVDGLLRKLNNLLSNHFNQPGIDVNQAKIVTNYIKFLEWQKCAAVTALSNKSVMECLSHCCAHHWTETAGKIMSPLTLSQQQQITPLQYDWVVLNVHAKLKNWEIVESIFTRKDWFGRSTVSSHIPLTMVIARLHELGSSRRLIATFVNKISNTDEKLQIATHFKVHSVVIETLAKQKDRQGLVNYKMALNPQSEEYILAENTLRTPSIKWKN